MQKINSFENLPLEFWGLVKYVSENRGYSVRARSGEEKRLKRYSEEEIVACLKQADVDISKLNKVRYGTSASLNLLRSYLNSRADLIEKNIKPLFMDRNEAAQVFHDLKLRCKPKCHLPMNKQKGEKKHYSYFTGIINMLTEQALGGIFFEANPRNLVTVKEQGVLKTTLSRWMDGAYPSVLNPYAVWEIKEYYGTKTFGSRVADGVYETMLDGFEIDKLFQSSRYRILHYLLIDDRFTWWECGRSYLCRIIDMAHMGFVDEPLFGREVLTRWPEIVASWPKFAM